MADLEQNLDVTTETTPPPQLDTPESEGPGSGRSSIRKDLEEGFERSRRDEERPTRRRRASGAEPTETTEGPAEPAVEGEETPPATPPQPQQAAPEGFSAEAKAEWGKTPPTIQQAILKREQDMSRGVQELRQRYQEIDQALQPRMDLIRRHGHTPAQAVNQLFAWFEALSANPQQAFPALMQSFRVDPRQIFGTQQQAQQQGQPQEPVPEATQQYINSLEQKFNQLSNAVAQKFGTLESTFQAQSEAKTKEILNNWAKDKPHFEEVRVAMAHMLSSGLVQPLPDGSADLDKAYDMALYAIPDVRTKILSEQQAKDQAERKAKADKERKAQQEAAVKARRASGGLGLSAPGNTAPPIADTKRGKSVKESLREAMDQFSGKGI